jgi:peptidoglycan L-alanyl-D-glutamate endopeptidase CwlK
METRVAFVVDSEMRRSGALAQNPASLAPKHVLEQQELLTILYYGFDGALHKGQIVVHKALIDEVTGFFTLALQTFFPIERVIPIAHSKYKWDDEVSCADNNSSGFNYRTITGTERLSNHAFGCAFDINPMQNPYISFDSAGNEKYRIPTNGRYDINLPGTLYDRHPLVGLMRALGWTWGGDWSPESGRVDYQHFEKLL